MFKSFQKYPLEICLEVFRNFKDFPRIFLKQYAWKSLKFIEKSMNFFKKYVKLIKLIKEVSIN